MSVIQFESETCPRCGGSGKYSFNLMEGDRCRGCLGSGKKLTKRGRAARQYFVESTTIKAGDVKAGDFIFESKGVASKRVWVQVLDIRGDDLNPGYVTIIMDKGFGSLGIGIGSKIRRVQSGYELKEKAAAAIAYQETLTKDGKPAKRVKQAA